MEAKKEKRYRYPKEINSLIAQAGSLIRQAYHEGRATAFKEIADSYKVKKKK